MDVQNPRHTIYPVSEIAENLDNFSRFKLVSATRRKQRISDVPLDLVELKFKTKKITNHLHIVQLIMWFQSFLNPKDASYVKGSAMFLRNAQQLRSFVSIVAKILNQFPVNILNHFIIGTTVQVTMKQHSIGAWFMDLNI